MRLNSFPHYLQHDAMDCGPTCLRIIAKYYGKTYSVQTLREHSFITREGVSMLGISDAAEFIGFRTSGAVGAIHCIEICTASLLMLPFRSQSTRGRGFTVRVGRV